MKKSILLITVFAFLLTSCDLAELNENFKDPSEVAADPLFTTAQVELGTFLHNPNVNVHDFMFMAQHWTMTLYTSETNYSLDQREVPSFVWQSYYQDVLINLQEAEELIKADEFIAPEVAANKLASIEVIQVLAYSQLVNIFGNVPYTEALNPENPQMGYDDARTIYSSIIDSLNTAISSFNVDAEGFGGADIFYNGDIGQWIKFANSLKLRLGMMLADVEPAAAATIVESAVSAGVFTSNADNAMIPFQPSPPGTNPVWENVIQSGRDDYIPAEAFVDRMNKRNDPRRAVFFTNYPEDTDNYRGGIYGDLNDYLNFSHFAEPLIEPGRDGVILGYSEVEFLLAEAVERGYAVGGTAAGHYANAITADMEFWNVPAGEISAYLAQPSVAYATAADTWRKKIGIQKWFGLWGQWLQAWTSFRRLDYPLLDAPAEAANGLEIVPVRYYYPVTEVRFNEENVTEAANAIGGDLYTTQLFWDVNLPN